MALAVGDGMAAEEFPFPAVRCDEHEATPRASPITTGRAQAVTLLVSMVCSSGNENEIPSKRIIKISLARYREVFKIAG